MPQILFIRLKGRGKIVIKPPKYCPHHWEQTKRPMETHKCNWLQKWGRGKAINKMRHQNKHPPKPLTQGKLPGQK